MYKKILVIFVALFLLSCDSQPVSNAGADGYRFGIAQYQKETVTIKLVTYDSVKSFDAEVKRRKIVTRETNSTVVAFAILKPPFDICEIHIVKPTVRYIPEFMGHETYHCFYGGWHK